MRISNNAIILFIVLLPCLVLFPYIQGSPHDDMFATDIAADLCTESSRTLIYTWEWKEKPVRFDLWAKEKLYFPFEGISKNNTYTSVELDKENSICSIEYYDRHGQYVTTKNYALSESPFTFSSHKWIKGKRCRALKGTLTVTVQKTDPSADLYCVLFGSHQSYRNIFYRPNHASMVSKNWSGVYSDGRIENRLY